MKFGTQESESEADVLVPMPTPPHHRLDQTGRDARGRLPLVRGLLDNIFGKNVADKACII